MKHEGYNVLAGNPAYSYKYNGKELQKEIGWLDYGWRQYMPETGKWNGMDQLSEMYASTSPSAYVANNPISMRDPDGRWMDASGHIDTSGNANPFRDMAQSQMRMTQFMGRNPGDGGGGSYMAFGDTQAYADLMDSFQNGGEFSLKVKNGFMSWWTGGAEGDANTAQEMIAHMMKLVQNSSNSLTDNFFNWIQGNPIKVSQFAGMIQAGSTVAEKGLSNWNGASNITKSRIFAETISTKLPFSAKALGTASTVLKGLGTTVGIVGLTNTFYQWKNGNISDTRAIVDGALGVAGFIPATAWISVVYFAGMALYETYGNDDKPLF